MGCFSFICKECGKPGNSDSHSGENVHLYFLLKGKVVEEMSGQYDSYGRVFDAHRYSIDWKTLPWSAMEDKEGNTEDNICDRHFNKSKKEGIALVHTKCRNKTSFKLPTTCSEDDPEQGWGRYTKTSDWDSTHLIHDEKGEIHEV